MVTKLPSSSEPRPDGQPLGCDTSDLIQVHRIFRWLYRELPGLIRGVANGDIARASVVADYASMDFAALHLHHETEDVVLWDRLVERSPAVTVIPDVPFATRTMPTFPSEQQASEYRLPRSHEAFARACRLIPGGVNSPARAFGAVGGEPPFIEAACPLSTSSPCPPASTP